jgi:hypothetical protein
MAVKNGDEFQAISTNAIGDDVRSVWDHKLPDSQDPARSVHAGLSLKEFAVDPSAETTS